MKGEKKRPLTMRETLSCVDDKGRIRCPSCGRFTTLDKITRDNLVSGPGVIISMLPRCDKCL